jgi:hypothetical protein
VNFPFMELLPVGAALGGAVFLTDADAALEAGI